MGDSCRPFHGLDGVLNLTQGSAFGSTLGFMLTPAPRALEKSFQNTLLKLITPSKDESMPYPYLPTKLFIPICQESTSKEIRRTMKSGLEK